jgi:crotonobetainyl-CoA:carnitine CoA-transferase CaiB-like acyl-CoA transferase
MKLSGTPVRRAGPAPLLGEHTDEVLREVLGCDDARIAALRAAGGVR